MKTLDYPPALISARKFLRFHALSYLNFYEIFKVEIRKHSRHKFLKPQSLKILLKSAATKQNHAN